MSYKSRRKKIMEMNCGNYAIKSNFEKNTLNLSCFDIRESILYR